MKYTTYQPLTYAGGYRVGGKGFGCCIMLGDKPNWLHRKLMKICLGFEWFDSEEF